MSWLKAQSSLYSLDRDKTGQAACCGQILLSHFGKDFPIIYQLRQLERAHDNLQIDDVCYKLKKKELKSQLQCWAPSALLQSRAAGNVISRTGLMQLDFDYTDIQDYDIEELKQAVFSLPFIAFCGLSCSGKGFYALALIAEPERLREYAEHCFNVFLKYGIKVDRSKGRNVNDLRYLSYDANMLIRENPEILKIKRFKTAEPVRRTYNSKPTFSIKSPLLDKGIEALQKVQVGNRWETVQRVAFTLGGLNDFSFLENIKQAINFNSSFHGEESKYIKCAEDCFRAGLEKPFQTQKP